MSSKAQWKVAKSLEPAILTKTCPIIPLFAKFTLVLKSIKNIKIKIGFTLN